MGSAFHQLCPRYSGTLTPTAPTAIRLWDTFTLFTFKTVLLFLKPDYFPLKSQLSNYTGWLPVMAVFITFLYLVTETLYLVILRV